MTSVDLMPEIGGSEASKVPPNLNKAKTSKDSRPEHDNGPKHKRAYPSPNRICAGVSERQLLFITLFICGLLVIIFCSITISKLNTNSAKIKDLEQSQGGWEVRMRNMSERQKLDITRHQQELTKKSECDAGWISFKHEKCFKVLDRLLMRTDAVSLCLQDSSSSSSSFWRMSPILTIHSMDEQKFVDKLVFAEAGFFDGVWLGADRVPNLSNQPFESNSSNATEFKWSDGFEMRSGQDFTNWIDGSPSPTKENGCVQMVPVGTRKMKGGWTANVTGKWTDVDCNKRNLVVCQKAPTLTLENLTSFYLQFRKLTEKRQGQLQGHSSSSSEGVKSRQRRNNTNTNLNTTSNLNGATAEPKAQITASRTVEKSLGGQVPLDFVYVQLEGQPSPMTIWPNFSWQDVSSSYWGKTLRVKIVDQNSTSNDIDIDMTGGRQQTSSPSSAVTGERHDTENANFSAFRIWKRIK